MNDSGHPGTPEGYSNSKQSLDSKSSSDAKSAIEAMKRRLMGPYGDDSGNGGSLEEKEKKFGPGNYPGQA